MITYNSIENMIHKAEYEKITLSDLIIKDQASALEISEEALLKKMTDHYQIMLEAIQRGIHSQERSVSGLTGGDANKMYQYVNDQEPLSGKIVGEALTAALGVAEVNACMGKIVAAPTAGSCGILPAVLWTLQNNYQLTSDEIVKGLFVASGIGMVIATVATVSGAKGGCQAECGSASAMATAAIIELMGGTPSQIGHGCALALKSVLGLVCDPVAGLVEVPCIKRNAIGVAQAFAASDLALAGIESIIPVDDVISAMKSIGDEMPSNLKETSEGGLATTKTGKIIAEKIAGQ